MPQDISVLKLAVKEYHKEDVKEYLAESFNSPPDMLAKLIHKVTNVVTKDKVISVTNRITLYLSVEDDMLGLHTPEVLMGLLANIGVLFNTSNHSITVDVSKDIFYTFIYALEYDDIYDFVNSLAS